MSKSVVFANSPKRHVKKTSTWRRVVLWERRRRCERSERRRIFRRGKLNCISLDTACVRDPVEGHLHVQEDRCEHLLVRRGRSTLASCRVVERPGRNPNCSGRGSAHRLITGSRSDSNNLDCVYSREVGR
ncbi:unnamed protein product [Leptosia nina]|uniref:Uncharacterized protein n=1 Tax=Leptosia nina TaxID=320188 RepID=A0AAV1K2P2_9NEOP